MLCTTVSACEYFTVWFWCSDLKVTIYLQCIIWDYRNSVWRLSSLCLSAYKVFFDTSDNEFIFLCMYELWNATLAWHSIKISSTVAWNMLLMFISIAMQWVNFIKHIKPWQTAFLCFCILVPYTDSVSGICVLYLFSTGLFNTICCAYSYLCFRWSMSLI